MKKLLALLLALFLFIAVFTGCDEDTPETKNPNNEGNQPPVQDNANPASDFEFVENEDGGITITKYIGEGNHVTIPQTINSKKVTIVGERSFAGANIISIVVPDTIIYISSYAFASCAILSNVKMSESLITISWGAFLNCNSLTTIDLSMGSLKYIDQEAFRGCQNLKNVKFGDNITLIRDKAFYDCISLEEVILPKNLQEIGEYAFMNCSSAKKIWIPQTLEKWGIYPFYGTKLVTEIIFEDGLKHIGNVGSSNIISYEGKMQKLRIPASVEHISEGAFMDCMNLKEIYFSGAAPQIGTGKFLDFVTPEQDVKIYYDPSMPGWDTTPLRNIYTLIPLS